MKKIVFSVLFLLLAQSIYAQEKNSIVLKFGITPYSQLTTNIEYSKVFDISLHDEKRYNYPNVGTVLYAEYYRKWSSIFNLGIGVSQQLYRAGLKPRYSYKADEEFQICFTSVYLLSTLKIYKDLYSSLHLGFNKLWATETEVKQFDRDYIGLYYAVGFCYEYNNFIFEFLYSVNHSKHESDFLQVRYISGNTKTVIMSQKEKYGTFNFNIGYKFDFNFPKMKI
ncbi:MAG: hypothetical protein LBO62_03795 [Endomicrobium sp.]|jgi:hypothetical protein|nr:hypothetical protein [Endomicrobium sp.]